MRRDWFFFYLILINLCLFFISICFITDIFQLNISYHLEQIFWFLSASSLAITYLSYMLGFVLFQEKKRESNDESLFKKKKNIREIVNYWDPLLWISISIILFDTLVVMYLKSLFPLDVFNNITKIDNSLGMALCIIYWIGTIILIISFLFFIIIYSGKNENNGSLK